MAKFAIKDMVEVEELGGVGEVVLIEEGEKGVLYDVDFIDEVETFTEEELTKAKGKEKTTILWESLEEWEEDVEDEIDMVLEKIRNDTIISKMKEVKNRYQNKCIDGNTFWQFFWEDVEKIIKNR